MGYDWYEDVCETSTNSLRLFTSKHFDKNKNSISVIWKINIEKGKTKLNGYSNRKNEFQYALTVISILISEWEVNNRKEDKDRRTSDLEFELLTLSQGNQCSLLRLDSDISLHITLIFFHIGTVRCFLRHCWRLWRGGAVGSDRRGRRYGLCVSRTGLRNHWRCQCGWLRTHCVWCGRWLKRYGCSLRGWRRPCRGQKNTSNFPGTCIDLNRRQQNKTK